MCNSTDLKVCPISGTRVRKYEPKHGRRIFVTQRQVISEEVNGTCLWRRKLSACGDQYVTGPSYILIMGIRSLQKQVVHFIKGSGLGKTAFFFIKGSGFVKYQRSLGRTKLHYILLILIEGLQKQGIGLPFIRWPGVVRTRKSTSRNRTEQDQAFSFIKGYGLIK